MKRWTEEEIELLIIGLEQGWTHREIANELDREVTTISKKCSRMGLGYVKKPKEEYPKRKRGKPIKTQEFYMTELPIDIEVLEPYTGTHIKILHKHTCGYTWKVRPHDLLRGHSCPMCNGGSVPNNKPASTYLIYFKELNLYKIGISSNFRSRIRHFGYKPEVILYLDYDTGLEAKRTEAKWLNNIKNLKVNTNKLTSGNTETFKYYG